MTDKRSTHPEPECHCHGDDHYCPDMATISYPDDPTGLLADTFEPPYNSETDGGVIGPIVGRAT